MNNSPFTDKPDAQLVLNQIIIDYMREQKRKRRWRWITRIILLMFILFLAYQFMFSKDSKNLRAQPHVGLVDINGTIFDEKGTSAESFAKSLDDAYKSSGLKALILRINSPGGSPVQADYMYNTLSYYRQKYPAIKTYAVCVDMCASAAYYLAAAAEEIYANPSSLVGSIGVVYNGFGFVDAMQKLGVTRRLHTAGVNKAILDPFLPVTPQHEQFLQAMLNEIHHVFIDRVKKGRGNRLKVDALTFSGLFWTGIQAKQRGLIDGFASSGQLARELIKIDQVIDYSQKQTFLEKVTKGFGTAIADRLPIALGLKEGIKA